MRIFDKNDQKKLEELSGAPSGTQILICTDNHRSPEYGPTWAKQMRIKVGDKWLDRNMCHTYYWNGQRSTPASDVSQPDPRRYFIQEAEKIGLVVIDCTGVHGIPWHLLDNTISAAQSRQKDGIIYHND